MSYEAHIKELKAEERAAANIEKVKRAKEQIAVVGDDPPGVDFDRWLEVAFKLSVVILAGGALGSTVWDIAVTVLEAMR